MAEKKINREYGLEKTLGDILYNKETKEIYSYFDMGFAGNVKIVFIKNAEGTYDLLKPYVKNGEAASFKLGKTFPVKNSKDELVDGITRGTLSLGSKYDKELEKNIFDTADNLYISTHKVKEPKTINEKLLKIGYVKGRFGIEVEEKEVSKSETKKATKTTPPVVDVYEDLEDEIPF